MAGVRALRAAGPLLLLSLFHGTTHANRTAYDDVRLFEDFKVTYGRRYSAIEEGQRFDCFRQMLDVIDERNKADPHAGHSVNQFTDLCPEEFAATYGRGYRPTHPSDKAGGAVAPPGPQEYIKRKVDWRNKGAVTPVKNQGQCGDCWAFTAVGNMESQWYLAGNELVGLSEEQVVECSADGNLGCNGGFMVDSYKYVIKHGGINSEAAYPYTSGFGNTGECKAQKAKRSVAHFSSYTRLPKNETAMADWVDKNGPISVAINSNPLQSYSHGILSDCPAKPVEFSVVVVGFDLINSPPYWIIKNSFGTSWGMRGYARIEFGINACGITLDPSSIIP